MDKLKILIARIYDSKSPDFVTDDYDAINELLIYFKIPEDKYELELLFDKLALINDFNWDNYVIAARVLNQKFPNVDLIHVTDEEVINFVISQPNFRDNAKPKDDDYITAIITILAELRDRPCI